jgi:hypothetical protein
MHAGAAGGGRLGCPAPPLLTVMQKSASSLLGSKASNCGHSDSLTTRSTSTLMPRACSQAPISTSLAEAAALRGFLTMNTDCGMPSSHWM